jgi:hypothetical protein
VGYGGRGGYSIQNKMRKLLITQNQFIRLMENVKKLILDERINKKDYILIKRKTNGKK